VLFLLLPRWEEPFLPGALFRSPDSHPTQPQRTPSNRANKVTEVMEQMGPNCFSLSELEGIARAGFEPEIACWNPSISGQIRVDFG
jgi:hypothetical protein